MIINPYTYSSGTAIPIANLVHYYRLNADANDQVGTLHGTETDITYTSGHTGNASTYNGTTSKISIPSGLWTSPTEAAVSFFVKGDSTSPQQRFISLNNNGNDSPFASIRFNATGAGSLEARLNTGGFVETNSYTITDWLHVIITGEEAGDSTMYVNGVSIGTSSVGNFAEVTPKGNFLGASRTGASVFFAGQIYGLGIWDLNLSAEEALAIYNKQNAGNHLI